MPSDNGFFIAIESFETFDPPMRLFSEHLVSNIGAYLALKNLPPTPVALLCGEVSVTNDQTLESFPICDEATLVSFDPIEGFVEPRVRVTEKLNEGQIVITDRFLHHVDEAMPEAHLSLPVEDLLFRGETQADCVIYITRDPSSRSLDGLAAHAHEVLLDLAKNRDNVHVVILEDQHIPVCDQVWREVKSCLRPWLYKDNSDEKV